MKKQFLVDKNSNIKASWVWADDTKCPHPDKSILCDGDFVLEATEASYHSFHSDLILRSDERMVTRDQLSVVSINSGRIVLDNLVKQT